MSTASVARVRVVPYSVVFPRLVLTTHCRIQDSVLTVESPSPVLRQHHSPPYGPSPGRDLAGNLLRLYLFPTHHGTTRMGHELYPPENSLYTGHTQEVAQWDISHDLPVPGSSWNNGIRDLHAADRSPPDHGERMYQTDAVQVPWWLRSVSADNSFTSYQTFVSVEGAFPLNTGSLIQQPHPSYDADHFAPTIEPNPSNRFPLSSGFRGPPSTPNQDDVRGEISALWQYLTFDFVRIQRHSIQHSEAIYQILTFTLSLQTSGRMWSPRGNTLRRGIMGSASQLLSWWMVV